MNNSKNLVITIGRCCGSGGKTVGKAIAERLKIDFYDRNLLCLASENTGISEELFANADEKIKSSLLYKVARNVYKGEVIKPDTDDKVSNDNLFNYQANVIKGLAEQESFVIIGRCADFVLKDMPNINLVRVFISASPKHCAIHEKHRLGITEKEAYSHIEKFNQRRAAYYKYYTGLDWGDMRHYDLGVNTSYLTTEECVDMILSYAEKKFKINLSDK